VEIKGENPLKSLCFGEDFRQKSPLAAGVAWPADLLISIGWKRILEMDGGGLGGDFGMVRKTAVQTPLIGASTAGIPRHFGSDRYREFTWGSFSSERGISPAFMASLPFRR
jgi:hypothetical protein